VIALGTPSAAAAQSPPGANDWGCKPSAAHPYPVVLVHGTFANMLDNWSSMSPALKASGYCVFALNYGGSGGEPLIYATGPIAESARQLDAFVARVRSATGARKVSLVGTRRAG
jgi:triacylglycerol lipase